MNGFLYQRSLRPISETAAKRRWRQSILTLAASACRHDFAPPASKELSDSRDAKPQPDLRSGVLLISPLTSQGHVMRERQ
jgi:hypothetical protein